VILPTQEALERRRRGYQRRGVVCVVVFVLMVVSTLVPHIGVKAADGMFGRSLFPASYFFLFADASSGGFGPGIDVMGASAGLNLAYYGLSLQHLGLLLGVFTFWSLAAETLGRWTRRGLLLAGWMFALSAPVIMTAYRLLEQAGVASYLGYAWAVCLVTGVIMIIGARVARERLDSTWFWTRPEWNG
jgi:NADH:ubiquinone oxidoreductase subunit 6 (subunit J)